ncbi:2-oxoglutarate dehydrogenase complex dihydrolipoyllysine-residue succinyltransferase [Legionella taurinensis]|uniref:Dihydrolipoyllysine-residue succinyltransferase component of 2-oxoglutarate dehydrogenase complex n=1 Tax=Legionella taurinensis TaxID=70611 RepID=A0AB38N6Y7_9GAMM|nr:2-oxoglutarate dehydrogenase complex dihydrolipoyllysine-residue succinyltransferase [Legionella taurinensis]MDX1837840.1 2-oxoglutarate dehydrogenase complex dihydrolipoyllysine-residue succinyltransferase [Legionella taurinensis]PUT39658.1 dihydrolipoamide succinyltransferase [Legionella taurinensis]PUT43351.1 dihydrolipoamide succinyltransferase [Legionella taurinensis]PUT45796.1 dihydrolipoamide succinyltransferase [Legionella taurinensis]PUT47709.1 dihydrolipoamide succinyltransferase 
MSIEVKVPALPESVADATIAAWHKKVGDKVARDENLVDLETDKVVLEVPAPADGILTEILFKEGDTVNSAQLLARIEAGSAAAAAPAEPKAAAAEPQQTPVSAQAPAQSQATKATGPAVRRMLAENNLQPEQLSGSGKDGRLTKEDVVAFIESNREKSAGATAAPSRSEAAYMPPMGAREERRVPMTRLRAKIAERLVQAQHNAAMLTTFNEVNLKAVMDLRAQYKDLFEKKHGVKLGFMSLFTKAVVESLKRFPAVNASIDGQDIVYHGYYDVGIAVSTDKGLVVPVVRDADQLSLAEIEKVIADSASRARLGKLSLEEMQGGTFTITNGGVFGSLLATPIINPPQTGILGMHKIEDRPVVEKGQIVIRPMMYVALSYDHRLIDGRESVQFLVSVKELLEDPARLLLNV